MRALTLSALAPRAGEILWDIGAGSGSISVEWCLAGGRAFAIETRADRAANIRTNAAAFGLANNLTVLEGAAPAALAKLPPPNAVFVGGGNEQSLFDALWAMIPAGTRLVANAVTLETEALLLAEQSKHGGELMRIETRASRSPGQHARLGTFASTGAMERGAMKTAIAAGDGE